MGRPFRCRPGGEFGFLTSILVRDDSRGANPEKRNQQGQIVQAASRVGASTDQQLNRQVSNHVDGLGRRKMRVSPAPLPCSLCGKQGGPTDENEVFKK